jgi:hypothetical protein
LSSRGATLWGSRASIQADGAFVRRPGPLPRLNQRRDPVNDPEVAALSSASREAFISASRLLGTPFEIIKIP